VVLTDQDRTAGKEAMKILGRGTGLSGAAIMANWLIIGPRPGFCQGSRQNLRNDQYAE
jgi:hypothetical protein